MQSLQTKSTGESNWKDRLSQWVTGECQRLGISERELAVRISDASTEAITHSSVRDWRLKKIKSLSDKSRRVVAKYRGWTVPQLQAWLDGEELSSSSKDFQFVENYLRSRATPDELVHISALCGQELKASLPLIKSSSDSKMAVHPRQSQFMSDIPPDLPKLPSFISGVLLQLIEENDLDRTAIASALNVSRDRVEALIATRTPISPDEYAAIASLINQHLKKGEKKWTAKTLRDCKEDWDRTAGKVNNGNGNGISNGVS